MEEVTSNVQLSKDLVGVLILNCDIWRGESNGLGFETTQSNWSISTLLKTGRELTAFLSNKKYFKKREVEIWILSENHKG